MKCHALRIRVFSPSLPLGEAHSPHSDFFHTTRPCRQTQEENASNALRLLILNVMVCTHGFQRPVTAHPPLRNRRIAAPGEEGSNDPAVVKGPKRPNIIIGHRLYIAPVYRILVWHANFVGRKTSLSRPSPARLVPALVSHYILPCEFKCRGLQKRSLKSTFKPIDFGEIDHYRRPFFCRLFM